MVTHTPAPAPLPLVAGYVTVPAGAVYVRTDYIPANQSSRHELEPGRYPVELVTSDGRPSRDAGGARARWGRVTVPARAGIHTYRTAHRETVTDLGAHDVIISVDAWRIYDGIPYRDAARGWVALELERPDAEVPCPAPGIYSFGEHLDRLPPRDTAPISRCALCLGTGTVPPSAWIARHVEGDVCTRAHETADCPRSHTYRTAGDAAPTAP